ncbi:hypothetical protein R1flu_013798 [Riccia fluitans]|uniref:Uncharacterized protein n=1 Tax=Riccia fluitans TaxID=41844 RepID=A0ABD1YHE7_9MARC
METARLAALWSHPAGPKARARIFVRGKMRQGPPFKLVLLGDGRVGKTSLVLRYVNNVFSEKQTATIQASYLTKRVNVDGQTVTLAIWDTAGQERFHALGPIYYRDADRRFARVKGWVKELRKVADKNIVLTIAGYKSDIDRHRIVDLQDSVRTCRVNWSTPFSDIS